MEHDHEWLCFCKNIQTLRKTHQLSAPQMARILRISVKTLSLLEGGVLPKRASANVIILLSRHFGIPPKDLFAPL